MLDDWCAAIGLPNHHGFDATRAVLAHGVAAPTGSLVVAVSWPSPPASPLLTWAARSIAKEKCVVGDARLVLAGVAGRTAKLLATTSIEREKALPEWRPRTDARGSARRDAMAEAFLRLKAGAPPRLPLEDLAPLLRVNARKGAPPWASRWKGFLGSARAFLEHGHGGRYGKLYEAFGTARDGRPFAFVLPRASVGRRRVEEIAAIPGDVDAVVLDFSPRWMGPWNVVEALEEALADLKIAPGGRLAAPVVVLVSDPRCALAALSVGKHSFELEVTKTKAELLTSFYAGREDGTQSDRSRIEPEKIIVDAVAVDEIAIAEELFDVADQVGETHPETADALAAAAHMLSTMAMSLRPPLAGAALDAPVETFVGAAVGVRETLRREGDHPVSRKIDAVLKRGEALSLRLLRETPARLALEEAKAAAAEGLRVGFVCDRPGDAAAVRREASDGLVIASRREAVERLADETFDRTYIVCRGGEAARIFAELPHPGREIRFVLTPYEAATAGRIADLVSSWPQLAAAHTRCGTLRDALPPTLGRLLGLEAKAPPARGARSNRRSRSEEARASAEVILVFEDGSEDGFALGAEVIVLVDDVPRVKAASKVLPGDLVVLAPQAVSDEIAREMGWDGEQALLDDEVTAYKTCLARWRAGLGAKVRPKEIIRRMNELDPGMPSPSSSAVRYWLAAADARQDPAPRATDDPRWFSAFCRVIEFEGRDTQALADHFDAHRARLRRDGHLRRCLVERFLFARYDVMLHQKIPPEKVEALKARMLSYVRAVEDVYLGGHGNGHDG